MSGGTRPIDEYATWVHSVVSIDPVKQTRDWAAGWGKLHKALSAPAVNGIFEFAAIVIARWEFLGGLYVGNADTSVKDAREYMQKFLVPVNQAYNNVAHLVQNPTPDRLDFFTMLRNKPLHGLNPAAVATVDAKAVVTWWMGFSGIDAQNHLTVDNAGGLHVDCNLLFRELQKSMEAYAKYLDADTDQLSGVRPKTRWRRAFWNRFAPKFMSGSDWTNKGVALGLVL